MAALTLPLIVFSSFGDTRNYTRDAHTVSNVSKVIQRRKEAPLIGQVSESNISVVDSAFQVDGTPLEARVTSYASVRFPTGCNETIIDSNIVDFRALVNSDEFVVMVKKQLFLVQ